MEKYKMFYHIFPRVNGKINLNQLEIQIYPTVKLNFDRLNPTYLYPKPTQNSKKKHCHMLMQLWK